jgi:hypothetical protein
MRQTAGLFTGLKISVQKFVDRLHDLNYYLLFLFLISLPALPNSVATIMKRKTTKWLIPDQYPTLNSEEIYIEAKTFP